MKDAARDMKKIYTQYSCLAGLFILCFLGTMHAQMPVASFTSSNPQGCAPYSVQFTSTAQNAVSFQWNFGNGNTSVLPNPSNVYTAPGQYTVSLTVTSAGGQTHTITQNQYITIYPNPVAGFTVSQQQGCRLQTAFQFTSTSVGAMSWFWDFGDGTFSTQANPSKIYGSTGTYNVSLLVTSAQGCTDVLVMSQLITVHELPNPQFTATQTSSCDLNHSFVFTPAVASGLSYVWHFGDGTTSTQASPSKVYGAPGLYTVKLIVTNAQGCIDSLVRNQYITIHTPVQANISATNPAGCPPLATAFSSNISNATSYQWNLGNGQHSTSPTPNTIYHNTGNYSVSLSFTMPNGCTYTSSHQSAISVHPVPTALFSVSNPVGCAPHTATIINQSTGATSFLWQYFDGQSPGNSSAPSHTKLYTIPAVYPIRLTATNAQGCSATHLMQNAVTVHGPTAQFSASHTAGCPPLQTQFSNTSTAGVSYLWNFGDGNTSTAANPQHTYTQSGQYTVSLTVTDANGCTHTRILDNYIQVNFQQPPYNAPAPVVGCAPLTSSFQFSNPGATSYLWDFGDGNTSTLQNPTHTFTQGGTYQVSLLVGQPGGCGLFYPNYQTVIVDDPQVTFQVSIDPCPPHAVSFTDQSINAVSWLWNFGDGTTSTLQNPTHQYADFASQNVSLSVTTASGCQFSYIGYNAVNFNMISAAWSTSYTTGPFPQTVQFTSLNPHATSWFWDFGDGHTSTEQNPVHTYQTEGTYAVQHTITIGNCQVSSDGFPFITNPAMQEPGEEEAGGSGTYYPPASMEPIVGCVPLHVSFFKQSQNHTVLEWNFGDGQTSAAQNPIHVYQQPGLYQVSYSAQTSSGVQTISYPQMILAGGVQANFSFTAQADCQSTTFQLQAQTSAAIVAYQWQFSNNTQASTPSTSITLPSSNSAYSIVLNVTDSLGCQSTRSQSVFTQPPLAGITYPTQVCKDSVFFNHSLPTGYSFLWSMGDGHTSSQSRPRHLYAQEGTYQPSVQITAPNGCIYEPVIPPIQFYKPVAAVSLVGPPIKCAPATFVVHPTGSSGGYSTINPNGYFWMAANGWTYGDSLVITINNQGSINYMLRVMNTNMPGCMSETPLAQLTALVVNPNFSFTQSGLCLPITAQFTNQTPNSVSWLWNFGNGQTSSLQHPTHIFSSFPTDSVSLTVTNTYGCTGTSKKPNIARFTAQFSASATQGCNPLSTTFQSSSIGVAGYLWDFGDGSTSTAANPTHTYQTTGVYTVKLIVTSVEGCSDTLIRTDYIQVMGTLPAFYSPTPANCAPSIVEFFDQSQGAVAWEWDFGDGSFSYVQNPSKIYAWPGQYDVKLTITAPNGCQSFVIYPNYVTVLGPATTFTASAQNICENQAVSFQDLSVGAVIWGWNFGDGHVDSTANPVHIYQTAGSYTVTLFAQDSLGCTAFYMLPNPIQVHGYPTAAFSSDIQSACAPMQVSFINQSVGASQGTWHLGNGSQLLNGDTLYHTYPVAGVFEAYLVIANEFGCTDTSAQLQIHALLVPHAQFSSTIQNGCTPLQVLFQNESTQLESPVFHWNFNNGTTSASQNPMATFTQPGYYDVSLTVSNANGCTDSTVLSNYIEVFDTLAPDYSPLVRVTVINESTVNIFWQQTSANDFGLYRVYRFNEVLQQFESIAIISDLHITSYSDQGLNTQDYSYCYFIETEDRCGYKQAIDPERQHCTINISAQTLQNNTIDVYWSPYVGKEVTNYVIYRRELNTSVDETVATVPGDVTAIVDTTVVCPVEYRYSVKAKGLGGEVHVESDSDYDISDPIQNLFSEQQVNTARSTVVNNEYILTEWAAPQVMGQYVTGYVIYRSEDNVQFEQLDEISHLQTSYVDENVDVNRIKYYYKVMAKNVCLLQGKEGSRSDNIVLKVQSSDTYAVKLEWTPYAGWAAGVAFYVIERKTANGSWQVIKQVPGNTISAVDEN